MRQAQMRFCSILVIFFASASSFACAKLEVAELTPPEAPHLQVELTTPKLEPVNFEPASIPSPPLPLGFGSPEPSDAFMCGGGIFVEPPYPHLPITLRLDKSLRTPWIQTRIQTPAKLLDAAGFGPRKWKETPWRMR